MLYYWWCVVLSEPNKLVISKSTLFYYCKIINLILNIKEYWTAICEGPLIHNNSNHGSKLNIIFQPYNIYSFIYISVNMNKSMVLQKKTFSSIRRQFKKYLFSFTESLKHLARFLQYNIHQTMSNQHSFFFDTVIVKYLQMSSRDLYPKRETGQKELSSR